MIEDRPVSCPPQHPDGWFVREKTKPVDLNLVEIKTVKPCEARPFPFWLSSLIASIVLSLVTVGMHVWILPTILRKAEFDAPIIDVTRLQERREVVDDVKVPLPQSIPVTRLPPVAPTSIVPIPVPARRAEIPLGPEFARGRDEPYDPELLVELDPEGSDPLLRKQIGPSTPESKPKPQSQPRPEPEATPGKGASHPARVLRRYQPDYPRTARRDKVEGRVMLDVQISSRGRVGSVRVISSSGSPVLDSTAISAVKRWSFAPAQKDGKPVSSQVHVPFRFSLR